MNDLHNARENTSESRSEHQFLLSLPVQGIGQALFMKKNKKVLKGGSLELYDAEDRLRIWMDAGDERGHAFIHLYSTNNRRIELSAYPDNSMRISIQGEAHKGKVTLTIGPDGYAGLWTTSKDGKKGVLLGQKPETDLHQLILFSNDKVVWKSPSNGLDSNTPNNG